ncbi:AbrB/MazE/SpoVT family DNA-binding domain-containing protein [Leptospira bandrabouensis]|uniref:AbrB/MazE/SpoVT family DNA-binding domain-containing protein n=1 Tax=Leptospira bandrabouensis TaxID=2484903 RepID=A0A6H3NU24_9LEPT|nr:AbrB/MazE/SpoVT family DNA-binding domain-containing protein [Leptospira bandrabouensis]MCG6143280.1 AbrB/MazE/SpoVT family DNA-binding domain-containing protein [Leptospira bandrabouensis]MCG6158940.1 AbrB/MazE/SpoVT family DNA-binding domain-containing protein [Leptospira bandrabouensis]MCG6162874.1 AbrB/MazE/SpoVT family DNA-binding domain-containing protein [Leptospira bandrabouensis]TGN04554.1 AbrB/MazE/SpoVT family DNA-binding domain-containing protein [Leptospira bandrabouensis]TGN14
MESTVQKWGNSLGIRIPKLFAKQLDLNDGSQVEVIQEGNRIIIYPYTKETLEQKLKKINSKNLHNEVDSGNSVGSEFW